MADTPSDGSSKGLDRQLGDPQQAKAAAHVAVIVLNWNAADETIQCLESVVTSDWPRLTVIAVDNGSREELALRIRQCFPGVIMIRNEANLGFAGGMNVGLHHVLKLGVDYVLLLNNDTYVAPSMVRVLVETAAAHPDAGMVCPLLLYRDRPDAILSAGLRCNLRRGYQGRAIGMGERDRGQFDAVREVAAPSGAAMLVPVRVLRKVGVLDEDLFLYGEDVEWGKRMQREGLRVYVAGRARVWHGLMTSSGGACSPLSSYYQTRNSFVVCNRYAPVSSPRAVLRSLDILASNLIHARRARRPLVNVRAVLLGWLDYRRGQLGACRHELPLRSASSGDHKSAVVSAGFGKTHVMTAAREVQKRGRLALAITGAYPTKRFRLVMHRAPLIDRGRLARLVDRDEHLPERRVRVIAAPELLFEAARVLGRLPGAAGLSRWLCAYTWRLYGWRAAREVRDSTAGAAVFHFRAGFGHSGIAHARERGMHVLCDHAIAHPLLLEELIASRGLSLSYGPSAAGGSRRREPSSPMERAILRDIEESDSIVVNSEFVKNTFLACGWPPGRVHVIYLGVDDNFLSAAGPPKPRADEGPLRLLFAGRLERRKGADVLVEALAAVSEPWELVVAGPVAADVRKDHAHFLHDPRVVVRGPVRRPELAQEMLAAPVFVFPSYAEGSARVVFEALACGCYVITTPNSGTIVEGGVHGALVPPGDVESLAAAIGASIRDRARVTEIGLRNAALIRERYRQAHYGDAVVALYDDILNSPERGEIRTTAPRWGERRSPPRQLPVSA